MAERELPEEMKEEAIEAVQQLMHYLTDEYATPTKAVQFASDIADLIIKRHGKVADKPKRRQRAGKVARLVEKQINELEPRISIVDGHLVINEKGARDGRRFQP